MTQDVKTPGKRPPAVTVRYDGFIMLNAAAHEMLGKAEKVSYAFIDDKLMLMADEYGHRLTKGSPSGERRLWLGEVSERLVGDGPSLRFSPELTEGGRAVIVPLSDGVPTGRRVKK